MFQVYNLQVLSCKICGTVFGLSRLVQGDLGFSARVSKVLSCNICGTILRFSEGALMSDLWHIGFACCGVGISTIEHCRDILIFSSSSGGCLVPFCAHMVLSVMIFSDMDSDMFRTQCHGFSVMWTI